MQGLLRRWTLAIEEYDYNIIYRNVSLNTNADAISHCHPPHTVTTVVLPQLSLANIRQAQYANSTVSHVLHARLTSTTVPDAPCWKEYPLRRHKQLWPHCKSSMEASAGYIPQLPRWKLCWSQSSPRAFAWSHSVVPTKHRQLTTKALNARSLDSDRRPTG